MNSSCPTEAELAGFLNRRLDRTRRSQVRDHLLECERCYEVVTEAAEFEAEDQSVANGGDVTVHPSVLERTAKYRSLVTPWVLAVAASLLVTGGVIVWLWL